jgi:hypothetical protein
MTSLPPAWPRPLKGPPPPHSATGWGLSLELPSQREQLEREAFHKVEAKVTQTTLAPFTLGDPDMEARARPHTSSDCC